MSLGKDINSSFIVNNDTKLNDLIIELKKYKRVFQIDLEKLINSCPFKLNLDAKQINKIYNITQNYKLLRKIILNTILELNKIE